VHARVCATLVRMAAEGPADGADGRPRLATTHEQLAVRCGVSRPKVSTALKRLERSGRLRLGRGAIEILDLPALQAAER
jgi:CRP/FNR family transcriptional regulator